MGSEFGIKDLIDEGHAMTEILKPSLRTIPVLSYPLSIGNQEVPCGHFQVLM